MQHTLNRRGVLGLGLGMLGATALAAPIAAQAGGRRDIVDTAVAAGSFGTLVAAVQAAGLVDTLKSPGPFTVFAPTDEAFAALPAGTVESLLLPENRDQLTQILTYHVAPDRYPASSFVGKRGPLATVEGGNLHVDGRNGVRINSSNVVTADVFASNGVIHVIDGVLLPS